jgi:hypothetical protein
MVKHAEFIRHISSVTGETAATINVAYRALREVGYFQGKQGVNAPLRTSVDAAVFLVWLGICDRPSQAPDVYRDFGLCRSRAGSPFSGDHLYSTLGLDPSHTLITALSALIDAESRNVPLPGYSVIFAADELNVAVEFLGSRVLYTREDDADIDHLIALYGRPYRVVRTFPRDFIRKVAAVFAPAAEA